MSQGTQFVVEYRFCVHINVKETFIPKMESLHKCMYDICHLRSLGQHILKMFFVDPYMHMIPN